MQVRLKLGYVPRVRGGGAWVELIVFYSAELMSTAKS